MIFGMSVQNYILVFFFYIFWQLKFVLNFAKFRHWNFLFQPRTRENLKNRQQKNFTPLALKKFQKMDQLLTQLSSNRKKRRIKLSNYRNEWTALSWWNFLHLFKDIQEKLTTKENRIYISGEFRESLGMNFCSPFHPER